MPKSTDLPLVLLNGDSPYTTSEIIAEGAGMNHRRVRDAIRKYEKELESFGKVGAYQTTLPSGQHVPIYHLNEQQAAFLLTLLKNTPVVVEFKKELVRQFYAMRDFIREQGIKKTLTMYPTFDILNVGYKKEAKHGEP